MKTVGEKIELNELEVNDTFLMCFGFDMLMFRVSKKIGNLVYAHPSNWLKTDSIIVNDFIEQKYVAKKGIVYGGKLKWYQVLFRMW